MTDLQRLFDLDPLKLTDQDIGEIVDYFRIARQKYVLGDKVAGAPKKMKAEKAPKAAKPGDIDLGGLEL